LSRHLAEEFDGILTRRNGKGIGELPANLLGLIERREHRIEWRAAFRDGFLKEAASERRGHEDSRIDRAGGLAEDGDIVGVAAETGDVVVDPLEGKDLIHEAVVARGVVRGFAGELGMSEEAEDVKAVIDGDDEHAVIEQRAVVIERA
jgi:hypothetical protein